MALGTKFLGKSRTGLSVDLVSETIGPNSTREVLKEKVFAWDMLVANVEVSYGPTATSGIRVRWHYSVDGVNYDSVEDADAQSNYYDVSFAAGQTKVATIFICA